MRLSSYARRKRAKSYALRVGKPLIGEAFEAVVRGLHSRVDNGNVWSILEELKAEGYVIDDDLIAAVNAIVANRISNPSQNVRARVYTKKGIVKDVDSTTGD